MTTDQAQFVMTAVHATFVDTFLQIKTDQIAYTQSHMSILMTNYEFHLENLEKWTTKE